MRIITDMETWLIDNDERIFRFLVYKKMFTPYETQQAFSDQSQYEDIYYHFAIIQEAIDLGNSEWLLGFREIVDYEFVDRISYYRLSDIRLEYFECDDDMIKGACEEEENEL